MTPTGADAANDAATNIIVLPDDPVLDLAITHPRWAEVGAAIASADLADEWGWTNAVALRCEAERQYAQLCALVRRARSPVRPRPCPVAIARRRQMLRPVREGRSPRRRSKAADDDTFGIRQGPCQESVTVPAATAAQIPSAEPEDEVLTVEDTAALLKVNKNVVYAMISRNELPFRRVGLKQFRLSRRAVMAWLAGRSWQVAKEGQ